LSLRWLGSRSFIAFVYFDGLTTWKRLGRSAVARSNRHGTAVIPAGRSAAVIV
jgi:hypothetical protein